MTPISGGTFWHLLYNWLGPILRVMDGRVCVFLCSGSMKYDEISIVGR